MNPRDVYGVPNNWTRGEDLEFAWIVVSPSVRIPTLRPARFDTKGPPTIGFSGPSMAENSEQMVFRGPNGIEECNRFAEWWFDLQGGESVRTIWSTPTFQYRPQTGRVIEGETVPSGRIGHRKEYDL